MNDITKSLEEYLKNQGLNYEVRLCEKQEKRRELLNTNLPYHDHSHEIKKSDAWIVWITDENQNIIDLQVYNFLHDSYEEGHSYPRSKKIPDYVNDKMGKTPYRDCGCVNSDWNEWTLQDVYFKLGIQYGFLTREIAVKCLKRLAYINEFRDNILKHLTYI